MRWPGSPNAQNDMPLDDAIATALARTTRPSTVTALARATGQPRAVIQHALMQLALDGRALRMVDWFEERLVVRWAVRT